MVQGTAAPAGLCVCAHGVSAPSAFDGWVPPNGVADSACPVLLVAHAPRPGVSATGGVVCGCAGECWDGTVAALSEAAYNHCWVHGMALLSFMLPWIAANSRGLGPLSTAGMCV